MVVSVSCSHCGTSYAMNAAPARSEAACEQCGSALAIPPALPSPPDTGSDTPAGGPAVAGDWQVGDSILGLYEVKGVLGQGGFGKVYRVHHTAWQMDLAVKTPTSEALERAGGRAQLESEAETWVQLGLHPNTVSCYYVRHIDAIPRIFIEYVAGGDLQGWIRDGRLYAGGAKQALARILDIAIQFAWGLHYAHEQRLIHQDVKPANVMLSEDSVAKVTDFGLSHAKMLASGGKAGETIMVNGAGYTPLYASPEQIAGLALTRRTDVWSWAVSVLEMFQGERTWRSGTIAGYHLETLVASGPRQAHLPRMPDGAASLLAECFREDQGERPANLEEVARRLVAVYEQALRRRYPRAEPRAGRDGGGSLNNRAVSLLDLERRDEALEAWDRALAAEPHHLQATYNRGLVLWRSHRQRDDALLRLLEKAHPAARSTAEGFYLRAQLHLERGDCESALELLKSVDSSAIAQDELRAATKLAEQNLPLSRRCVRACLHDSPVYAVVLHEDGRTALSGGHEGEIEVWDMARGRSLLTLEGHKQGVVALALDRRARRAVSAGRDRQAILWDLSAGNKVRTFEGDKGYVHCVAISAGGEHVLTGGDDRTPRLWKVDSQNCVRAFHGHADTVSALWLRGDGRRCVSASIDGTLKYWRVSNGECLRTMAGHEAPITCVSVSSNTRFVLSGSRDGVVKLWRRNSGTCLRTTMAHEGGVTSVALMADGQLAVSAGNDGDLRLWDIQAGHCVHTFPGNGQSLTSLSVSSDERYVLSGGTDRGMRLWSLEKRFTFRAPFALSRVRSSEDTLSAQAEHDRLLASARKDLERAKNEAALDSARRARALPGFGRGKEVMALWRTLYAQFPHRVLQGLWQDATLSGHLGAVRCLAMSPAGHRAISGSDDETIRLWDLETGRCVRTLRGHTGGISALTISPDGCFALSASDDGALKIWNLEDSISVTSMKGHEATVTSLSSSFDWRLALSASADGTMKLWNLATGHCVRSFQGNGKAVNACAMSPAGHQALSGGADRMLKFWELGSGRCVGSAGAFRGHARSLTALAPSADGRIVLTGSDDCSLKLWKIGADSCVRSFAGHKSGVTSVSLSHDGEYALSGARDGLVKLWRVASGDCLYELEGHGGPVHAVCLSRDRSLALSGDDSGGLKVWTLDWQINDSSVRGNWEDAVSHHLEVFLAQRVACATRLCARQALADENPGAVRNREHTPRWSDENLADLREGLRDAGYGWVEASWIRAQLRDLRGHVMAGPSPADEVRRDDFSSRPASSMPSLAHPGELLVLSAKPAKTVRRFTAWQMLGALVFVVAAARIVPAVLAEIDEYRERAHAEALMMKGVGVNGLNAEGESLLHRAARQGRASMAAFLIAEGADPNARNAAGWTPLHTAARLGYTDVVYVLLANGARIDVEAGTGRLTPLWLADDAGHQEVVNVLVEAGAR